VLDLDHFKSINDRHGHAVGDRVLQVFAQVAVDRMRRMDLFGRIGGEEFAALLVDTTRERAISLAQEIRASFAATGYMVGETAVTATVSIGVVICYDAGLDLAALLAHADHALYQAKDKGRNRVETVSIEFILDRGGRDPADILPIATAEPAGRSAA